MLENKNAEWKNTPVNEPRDQWHQLPAWQSSASLHEAGCQGVCNSVPESPESD